MDRSYVNIFFLISVILIIIARAPSLLLEPRFWAEEGTIYFYYAYYNPWYKVLFTPQLGYYSLFPNIAAFLAQAVPLKYSPLVTTYLALVVQIIPFLIILWSDSRFWDTYAKKILVSLIIIFPVSTGEIWLNTINSQFYFGVITFLILLAGTDKISRLQKWLFRILLLVAGLTGVVSCFLTPIFFLRAYQEKNKEYTRQAVILVLCSVLQFAVFISFLLQDKLLDRFTNLHLWKLAGVFLLNNFIRPILGFHSLPKEILIYLALPLVICLGWLFAEVRRDKNTRLVLAGFFLVALLSTVSSLGLAGAERYSFLPGIILLILISSYIQFNQIFKTARSIMAVILLFISIGLGIIGYRSGMANYVNAEWPQWREEVVIWETTPDYNLKIWPQWEGAKWFIGLRKRMD
ncbi:MAG: hypothetical protein AB1404_02430 [Spirochaetota bacterium]